MLLEVRHGFYCTSSGSFSVGNMDCLVDDPAHVVVLNNLVEAGLG